MWSLCVIHVDFSFIFHQNSKSTKKFRMKLEDGTYQWWNWRTENVVDVDIITNLKFKQIRGATKSARSSASNKSCNVGCRCIPSVGSLAVYAGEEHRCFVIPTRFLNLLVFVSLLNKVEEEFGFQTTGKFVLPCDVVFFKELLNILEREKSGFGALDLDDFSGMFSDLASDSYSLC